MKSSKLLCILSALATALLVLSASVAAPIPVSYTHLDVYKRQPGGSPG